MIFNHWDPAFYARYKLPTSYLAFDTEYTGNDAAKDLLLEVGHVMVVDGQVVDKLSVVFNWYDHPGIDRRWLDSKLSNLKSIIGPGWRLMPDCLRQEGINPVRGLKFLSQLLETWKSRGLPFVAHNGAAADERVIRSNFNRFINKSFVLPDDGFFDTGAIVKATTIFNHPDPKVNVYKTMVLPMRSETIKGYCKRILGIRMAGVKWNVSSALQDYGLMEKHAIEHNALHNAGYDAQCLVWLMDEFHNRLVVPTPKAQSRDVPANNTFTEETQQARKPQHRQRLR